MRVLVTGGAGYIGSVLVRQLLNAGHFVRVVDTFQYREGGPPAPGFFAAASKFFDAVVGDIRQANLHLEWFDGIDAVAHLAGFSNDPTADADPTLNNETNVFGTIAVAETAIAAGIQRFTFASSASIYDDGEISRPEMQFENGPVHPLGAYSVSKYNAEQALRHPHIAGALAPIIFRQGTVYGLAPRMRFDLVVNAMTRDAVCKGKIVVHGGAELWRPMLSVEGCAAVHAAALTSEWNVGPRLVNVVDQNVHVREIAARVKRAVDGLRLSLSPVEIDVIAMPSDRRVRNYRVDALEWRDALGPQPMDEMEEQIVEIARWLNSEAKRDSSFDPYAARFENLKAMQTQVRTASAAEIDEFVA